MCIADLVNMPGPAAVSIVAWSVLHGELQYMFVRSINLNKK